MAWPIGRLWRVCMAGVGVGCTVCRRAMALYMRIGMVCYGVCRYGAMACVGTVCRRWVYGVQALGVRMVYVVYVSCGVRCVYGVYVDTLTW